MWRSNQPRINATVFMSHSYVLMGVCEKAHLAHSASKLIRRSGSAYFQSCVCSNWSLLVKLCVTSTFPPSSELILFSRFVIFVKNEFLDLMKEILMHIKLMLTDVQTNLKLNLMPLIFLSQSTITASNDWFACPSPFMLIYFPFHFPSCKGCVINSPNFEVA